MASVRLDEAQLFGENAAVEHEPYVLLHVDRRVVVYTGLSVSPDPAPASTYTVRWVVAPSRLATPGAVVELVTTGTVLWYSPAGAVATDAVPAATLAAWAVLTAGPPHLDRLAGGELVERADTWEVVVATPRPWAAPLAAGEAAPLCRPGVADGKLRLVLRGAVDSTRHKDVTLQLPGPVVSDGVVVSADATRVKVVAPKARYDLSSRVPADLWVGDAGAWAPTVVPAEVAIHHSGIQMSEAEKFIARSRPPGNVPPFVALKDTLMFLYQCADEVLFNIVVEAHAPGVPVEGAILLLHGLRQEHRSGVLAADVSVCFMEPSFAAPLSPFVGSLHRRYPSFRSISVSEGEYALLRKLVEVMAARAKDAGGGGVAATSPRVTVPPPLRRYFTRALLQPLYAKAEAPTSSSRAGAMDLSAASCTPVQTMQAEKDAGVALVRAAKWGSAAAAFRRVVVAHQRSLRAEQAASQQRRLAGVAFLNLSLCLLHGAEAVGGGGGGRGGCGDGGGDRRDDPSLTEAVVAATEAAELLATDEALVAKASYRKGLALERLERLPQAAAALATAAARLPADPTVAAAVRRVQRALSGGE